MSEFLEPGDSFDDSFESGSESESGLIDQETVDGSGDFGNSLHSKSDTYLQLQVPSASLEIHRVKELSLTSGQGALSDPDEVLTR